MIKFRYKRKETTNNGGSNASNSNTLPKCNSSKSVEIKSNETNKDDNKLKPLKCETIDNPALKPLLTKIDTNLHAIKTKTNTEQEYMEDCIRAIVVSEFLILFFFSNRFFFFVI